MWQHFVPSVFVPFSSLHRPMAQFCNSPPAGRTTHSVKATERIQQCTQFLSHAWFS
jgi:hypothetical protein